MRYLIKIAKWSNIFCSLDPGQRKKGNQFGEKVSYRKITDVSEFGFLKKIKRILFLSFT